MTPARESFIRQYAQDISGTGMIRDLLAEIDRLRVNLYGEHILDEMYPQSQIPSGDDEAMVVSKRDYEELQRLRERYMRRVGADPVWRPADPPIDYQQRCVELQAEIDRLRVMNVTPRRLLVCAKCETIFGDEGNYCPNCGSESVHYWGESV